ALGEAGDEVAECPRGVGVAGGGRDADGLPAGRASVCWYPRTAQRGRGWPWVVRVLWSRCRRITALASTDLVPWQTGHMAGELLTSADAAKALAGRYRCPSPWLLTTEEDCHRAPASF